jgi:translation initiation factor IF-2
MPPKPPAIGARPTVPLKPAPAAGAAPAAPVTPAPAAAKPAAPKKETARITIPAEGAAKAPLPKATVKMQQTQPLVNRPAPAAAPVAPISAAPAVGAAPAEADGTVNLMSIAALVVSIISLALVFFAYSAANS